MIAQRVVQLLCMAGGMGHLLWWSFASEPHHSHLALGILGVALANFLSKEYI